MTVTEILAVMFVVEIILLMALRKMVLVMMMTCVQTQTDLYVITE